MLGQLPPGWVSEWRSQQADGWHVVSVIWREADGREHGDRHEFETAAEALEFISRVNARMDAQPTSWRIMN